jgi:3-hydroxybutyryl-CoA dehydrogenase
MIQRPRVAVVGTGVMGSHIALVLTRGSSTVSLFDVSSESLRSARDKIARAAEQLGEDPAELLGRLETSPDLESAVRGAALVVEAGPENIAIKREIFSEVQRFAPADAVLASNTSAIPIRAIATALSRPERMLGTHFWNPPHLVPLVEVVQSDCTQPRLVEWTMNLLSACGMSPVHVRADVPGFIGNRLQHALKREAIALVADGVCDAETLDTVVKQGFGARLGAVGPLEQADLGGLKLTLAIHEVVMPALNNTPVPHPLLRQKVASGELGAQTGKGFRSWRPGEAEALRAQVEAVLLDAAQKRPRNTFPPAGDDSPRKPDVVPRQVGGRWRVKLGADETDGRFALFEVVMPSEAELPPHRSADMGGDSWLLVLSGALRVLIGADAIDAKPGTLVTVPPRAGCGWRAEAEEVHLLLIASAGRAAFYRDAFVDGQSTPALADAAEPDRSRLAAVAKRHGVELLAWPSQL